MVPWADVQLEEQVGRQQGLKSKPPGLLLPCANKPRAAACLDTNGQQCTLQQCQVAPCCN
jgi:hypothetical protein